MPSDLRIAHLTDLCDLTVMSSGPPPGFSGPPPGMAAGSEPQPQPPTYIVSNRRESVCLHNGLKHPAKSTDTAQEPPPMSQDQLDAKARKWNSLQGRRFGATRKTHVDPGKQMLPPEALRRIIKDHGDMR